MKRKLCQYAVYLSIPALLFATPVAAKKPVLTYLPRTGDFTNITQALEACDIRAKKVRAHMNKVWRDPKIRSTAKDVQYRRSINTQNTMRQFAKTDCMSKRGFATIWVTYEQNQTLENLDGEEKSDFALNILSDAQSSTWKVDMAGRGYDGDNPVPLKEAEIAALVDADLKARTKIYYQAIRRLYRMDVNRSSMSSRVLSRSEAKRMARRFAKDYMPPIPAEAVIESEIISEPPETDAG